uniref:Golgi membrane protein 1 n=1 Tax=Catagonus wagneri TaxID=51154 RepID=A0A8C3WE61_9CETA
MMGLGNGRRSMKSPPLVLAALVACVIVLGFNYWIASSRSADLQTRIVELEGRVRRAAVERGAVEMKKNEFQGELEKQREQLDKIQSSHNFQMESVNKLYQDEKAVLVNNITTSERLIRTLQEQLKALERSHGRLQQEVFQFQKNQTNLERKFSYDLNQCISQMKEVKEQCEERIEEVTKKGHEAAASRDLNEQKDQSLQLRAPNEPQPAPQEAELPQAGASQARGNTPAHGEPRTPAPSAEAALDSKRQGEQEDTEETRGAGEEEEEEQAAAAARHVGGDPGEAGGTPPLASREEQDAAGPERDPLGGGGGKDAAQEADEEGREPRRLGADDDYNAEENEAESETDKQAALAGDAGHGDVLNAEHEKGDVNLLDQREKGNHTL